METDESQQLKANMVACAKVAKGNLNRLNCEWRDFVDCRLQKIIKTYYTEDEESKEKQEEIIPNPYLNKRK